MADRKLVVQNGVPRYVALTAAESQDYASRTTAEAQRRDQQESARTARAAARAQRRQVAANANSVAALRTVVLEILDQLDAAAEGAP